MDKNVLLLGGTWAMGIALIKILSEQNHNVYVTTRKDKTRENTERVHYLQGNAHDIAFITNAFVSE